MRRQATGGSRSAQFELIRYLDLSRSDVNCDLQVHTTWTDGEADSRTLLALARERGLRSLAFTEHVRTTTDWFPAFAREVRGRSEAYPQLVVLVGCEAKALDTRGTLDATGDVLALSDIVLGSVHRMSDGRGGFVDPAAISEEDFLSLEVEFALGLLDAAPIDVLAHPAGMYLRRYPGFPKEAIRTILLRSLERGVAVEINSTYLGSRLDVFLELCADINPYVSIGSDVHRPEQLAQCRDRLWALGIGAA